VTTTVLGIYSAALSAMGGKGRLITLSDNTREREECDIWYAQVRDQVQEAAYWPSSRITARLTLLTTRDQSVDWVSTDPETDFIYKYALPTNCLRPWYLANFEQFMLAFDVTTSKVTLHTNVQDAVLIYAMSQADPAVWTPGQRSATLFGLAAAISFGLTNNRGIEGKNYQIANENIMQARVATANAPTYQLESIPPALAARGFEGFSEDRFYYPYGQLFSSAVPNA
jgi:hypothetical protein